MKAIFVLVVFLGATLYKRFIENEERAYYLKISSMPVNLDLKRKQVISACTNVRMTKAAKKRKK
jgi:hypothetical protein